MKSKFLNGFSLAKHKSLKKEIMDMLSKQKDLWSERSETIKAIRYTVELKEGTRSIHYEPYRSVKWSLRRMKLFNFVWITGVFNVFIIPNSYFLLRTDHFIDSFREAKMFAAFDALWGYRQVLIKI